MADDEQFSLCWNNFNSNLSAGFHESLCRGDLVDVTLAAEGQLVKAHRLVLSVCSPYFRKMFTQMPANQHAFVFLKDVSHTALKDLIQFMYCGEVNVKQEALPAFISTAEALQIKGLTDSDPPPSQTPPEPSTPTPPIQQIQQQIQTSPRVRQRTSTSGRSYKIETVDDSGDDTKQTTQIVIQTTAAPHPPQATIATQPPQQQQQQHHHQQQPPQHITQQPIQTQAHQLTSVSMPTSTTTAAVVTHKRPAQRTNLGSVPHIKRTKSTIDPLEAADATVAPQQMNVQTTVVTTEVKSQAHQHHHQQQQQQQQHQAQHHHQPQPQQTNEPEYIDLPIELPTKSEPDYAEDAGEVDQGEQDGTYVEDEAYGDMRYDESYFTEGEDVAVAGNASAGGAPNAGATATTSKAIVKQQPLSDSYMDTTGDQANSDAQDDVKFIRSQKKNAQLVYKGFIYNKKLTQANGHTTWRCIDVLKTRCKAVVITKKNELVTARRDHNHEDHIQRINQRPLYSEEEDLGDYIEIKPDSASLNEYISMANVDILAHKSGKEYKLFVPSSCSGLDMKDTKLVFIESPWATPCLILNDFMYNCHSRKSNKEYWRCHNYSKKELSERCRSRCVLENGKLKAISGGLHNHPPHTEKIEKMIARNRMTGHQAASIITRIKTVQGVSLDSSNSDPLRIAPQLSHLSQLNPPQQHQMQTQNAKNEPIERHSTIMLIHD